MGKMEVVMMSAEETSLVNNILNNTSGDLRALTKEQLIFKIEMIRALLKDVIYQESEKKEN